MPVFERECGLDGGHLVGAMTCRSLTDHEIRLIDAALIEQRRFRERLFFLFALGTGHRVSEVLSLDWSQLLTSSGEIARETTIERAHLKGGAGVGRKVVRSRRVPLTERVKGAIADYLASLGTVPVGPVFKSRVGDNKPITRGQAHRQLKRLARELGLDAARIGCHSARKAFAMKVHRAGGFDLIKTQRVMGHSSPLTTAAYLETAQDELDSLILGIDQAPALQTALAGAGTDAFAPRRPGSL